MFARVPLILKFELLVFTSRCSLDVLSNWLVAFKEIFDICEFSAGLFRCVKEPSDGTKEGWMGSLALISLL